MKMVLAIFLIALAHGASAQSVKQPSGEETAAKLTARYNDISQSCGRQKDLPASSCSGVLLRGIDSTKHYSWDPSPGSQERGGVSFSYLRKDAKFPRLAFGYKNGIIVNSDAKHLVSPEWGAVFFLRVICAFPTDAWTDRRSEYGCGQHRDSKVNSRPCVRQVGNSASQWQAHYTNVARNTDRDQCSFIDGRALSDGTLYLISPEAFYQSIVARNSPPLADKLFNTQNEVVVEVWKLGDPIRDEKLYNENLKLMPIHAFFYLNATGLVGAKKDRDRYLSKTGRKIPLIKITLPATRTQDAVFAYLPADNT